MRARAALLGTTALVAASIAFAAPARAQDATWNTNPGSSDFNSALNWTPAAVPFGFATFGNSSVTTLTFSGNRNLDGFVFDAGAPAYIFNMTSGFGIAFNTDGIINNSSNAPTLNVSNSPLHFDDSSNAGNAIINLTAGTVQFLNSGNAGAAQLNAVNAGTTFDFTGTTGPLNDNRITAGSISGAGNFDLGLNVLTVGSNDLSTTVSGTISGTALEKVGSGTLTLAGTNTYTGGTATTAGAIEVTNNSSVSTGDVVFNGGTFRAGADLLDFANSFLITAAGGTVDTNGNTLTISGTVNDLVGAGGLNKIGAGTLILSNANGYTGGTTITAGTVQVTNADSVGSGAVTLNGGAFKLDSSLFSVGFLNDFKINTPGGTIDNNGAELTLSGIISNGSITPGLLTLTNTSAGAGLTLLSGVNTYSGGTKVVDTTLQVDNNSSIGTGTVTLQNALFMAADTIATPTLSFANPFVINSTTFGSAIDVNGYQVALSGGISGAGKLTVEDSFGGGVLVLTGTSTYTGGTIICSCGTLTLGTASTAGSIVGAVTNEGGTLNVVNSDTSGITTILNQFGGVTSFQRSTTASSIQITNETGGSLEFRNTASAANATINNGLGATTAFENSSTAANATINNTTGAVAFNTRSTLGSGHINNTAGGFVWFTGQSTGGDALATIVNTGSFDNGMFVPPTPSQLIFDNHSSAGSATITNSNGAFLAFDHQASAENATIANSSVNGAMFFAQSTAANAFITTTAGAGTFFFDRSSGGTARFVTEAGGVVDFSQTRGPNVDRKNTAGSIAGAGDYYLGGNAFTVGSNNLSTTVSGTINDGVSAMLTTLLCGCGVTVRTGASLEKIGTGTMTLSGINTYTGGTIFTGGTVSVSQEANLGALAGALTFNGGTLQITGTSFTSTSRAIDWRAPGGAFDIANAANNFTVSQILAGGSLTKLGPGTLTLSGANTYGGLTTVAAGTLSIGADNNIGISSVAMLNGSTLQFTGSFTFNHNITVAGDPTFDVTAGNTTSIAGTIADGATPGDVVKTGAGTLILSGNNTYSGGTTVLGGVLQLGNGGTTGLILGGVVNNATLAFNRSDTVTFGGVISGTGVVRQDGPGTTVLTAMNSYAGGTIINAGVLQLGNGATTGSIVGDVVNNATLAFNRSNTLTFAGAISGTGTLVQNGTGTTILSGNSTYTGPTNVNVGTLIVNGSIASSSLVTVNAGATLGGNGTVGPTNISGTLSPGNSIGTITVNGNLTFVGAGNYLVEVSPAAADRTNVTGVATLAGSLQITGENALYKPKRYTLLNANNVSGTFAAVSINGNFGAAVRNPHVEYDAGNVYFVLDPNAISPFLLNGNVNQKAVAGAIDTVLQSGTAPSQFLKLFDLPASALPNALSQLSGEIGTAAPTAAFKTVDQFLNVMLDPFLETRLGDGSVQGRALSLAPESAIQAVLPAELLSYDRIVTKAPRMVAPDQRWTVWGAAYGAAGKFSGDVAIGSNNLNISTGSFAAGIDYRIAPNTVIGAAVSGSAYNYNLDSAFGTGRGNLVQGGLYASTRFLDHAYVSAALSYGRHDLSTERTVAFGGIFDRLSADFSGNSFGGRIETGYRFAVLSNFGVTPYAALQAQRFETGAYAERDLSGLGLAGFALNYAGRSADDTRSELGARFDYRTLTDAGLLTWRGRVAWGHEFSTDRSLAASFQAAPGVPFTVIGAAQAADVALLSAGAELRMRNGVALRAKFDGEFSGRTSIYGGTAGLYVTW